MSMRPVKKYDIYNHVALPIANYTTSITFCGDSDFKEGIFFILLVVVFTVRLHQGCRDPFKKLGFGFF